MGKNFWAVYLVVAASIATPLADQPHLELIRVSGVQAPAAPVAGTATANTGMAAFVTTTGAAEFVIHDPVTGQRIVAVPDKRGQAFFDPTSTVDSSGDVSS